MNVLTNIRIRKEIYEKFARFVKLTKKGCVNSIIFLRFFYEAKTVIKAPSFGVFRQYLTFIYMLASDNVYRRRRKEK